MRLVQQIRQLLGQDSNLSTLPNFFLSGTASDPNHTTRRMQQRAIAIEMIEVALLYGKCERCSQATTYTLLDKTLRKTPYEKFLDKLRGLRVIAQECPNGLEVTSVYWAWDLR
ncbi:MAG: DUF4258 domain-containing protein [Acaryochloridaceae cyanobacterium RU_4_10]|jgi:hypothetical protein|nr:DUF4258 domain-containing protein [Acaryochloridaceae cyanobacterium RU_4_10]